VADDRELYSGSIRLHVLAGRTLGAARHALEAAEGKGRGLFREPVEEGESEASSSQFIEEYA
jgi:hypothetical protein